MPPRQRRGRRRLARDARLLLIGATQIGLTATPKETKDVSNIHYFGEPVYTYSLKQGIDDGFLAPYKVVRIDIDKDLTAGGRSQGRPTSTAS
jgi:type I site-specific restriction endonuclease